MLKRTRFKGKPVFFFYGFDETRTKNDGFTCYFGVRTWNLWWFHWNQVFFGGVEAEGLSFTKKTCVSMNTTTGFQVLISKVTREYHHFFVRVSLNTVNKIKKNMSAFPLKLFISHWRPNFCPWIASNFSKYCFNIFPKKKILKPLLKPQTICKKSKIPYYGVVNVVKIWDFENHPTRVFLIHVFYRNLKLFMVFIFRLPSRGVLPRVFFFFI